jgi:hypothetical protein
MEQARAQEEIRIAKEARDLEDLRQGLYGQLYLGCLRKSYRESMSTGLNYNKI